MSVITTPIGLKNKNKKFNQKAKEPHNFLTHTCL